MKTPLKRARSVAPVTAEKSGEIGINATQKPARKPVANAIAKPNKSSRVVVPTNAATPKLSVKKSASAKSAPSPKVRETLFDDTTTKTKLKPSTKSATLRATKKRAPKDLANQYGEVVKAARTPVTKAAPRKRRNAATRAKLQAVIAPDDGLLQRLARAGAISTSHVSSGENGSDDKSFRSPVKRRSRKWETRCGKCGVNAQYSTAAALCVKCGAILVRD